MLFFFLIKGNYKGNLIKNKEILYQVVIFLVN